MRVYLVFFSGFILLCQHSSSPALAAAGDSVETKSDRQQAFQLLDSNGDGQLQADEIPENKRLLFERLLRTADANHDGGLSLSEFTDGLKVRRAEKPLVEKRPARLPGSDELLLLLAICDKNADGTITPEEPPEHLQPFYQQLKKRAGDKNRDRVVIRQVARIAPQVTRLAREVVKRQKIDVQLEYALLPDKNLELIQRLEGRQRPGEALADPDRAAELFQRFDADGNGQIVYEEVPEQFADRFDQLLERADRNEDEQISRQELEQLSARMRALTKARERREERQKAKERRSKQSRPKQKPQKADQTPGNKVQENSPDSE